VQIVLPPFLANVSHWVSISSGLKIIASEGQQKAGEQLL
jgi:hypothetical protein